MNIWRAKRDARKLSQKVQHLIYNTRDGWMVARWNGSNFIRESTSPLLKESYAMDDVEAVFELPYGKDCERCRIPSDLIRCPKTDLILLRCAQCGCFVDPDE